MHLKLAVQWQNECKNKLSLSLSALCCICLSRSKCELFKTNKNSNNTELNLKLAVQWQNECKNKLSLSLSLSQPSVAFVCQDQSASFLKQIKTAKIQN
jgi:hypothetical protein